MIFLDVIFLPPLDTSHFLLLRVLCIVLFAVKSENGTGSSSNLLGKSTPMARPGSASIRQRRPSITLDKIPESLNENRPSSKKVAGAGSSGSGSEENSPRSMSSPHEDRGDGFKVGSGGTSSSSSSRNAQIMTISSSADERMLNINISEPNCDCTDIVASCYYSPITPAYIPFREDASRAMSKEQAKAHVQQYSNSKGNLLRWVCTGLTPQILELPLVESFRVNRVHIQCYGEVEEMTMHLTETGTTGLSGHITSLDCPRNLTAGDNSSFSIDVLEQIDASSHILNSPSDVCNKVSRL